MKILIMGGTGMIGGHTAELLLSEGHQVILGARKPAAPETPMAKMDTLICDYTDGSVTPETLAPFDAIVFAAGNDIRHITKDDDQDDFWTRTQTEGVPNFIRTARDAGVKRVVHIGSYYHQKMPHLIDENPYVRARAVSDEKSRALATADFNVCTLNPPSIIGVTPGLPATRYERLTAFGKGKLPDVPLTAPPGGTNYMSVLSLTEAIRGALLNAENGKAYLIGDESLRFSEFFQLFLDAVGNPARVVEEDAEHPLLPDAFIVPGRGSVMAYEPNPAEVTQLGYRRNDVRRAVEEVVRLVG